MNKEKLTVSDLITLKKLGLFPTWLSRSFALNEHEILIKKGYRINSDVDYLDPYHVVENHHISVWALRILLFVIVFGGYALAMNVFSKVNPIGLLLGTSIISVAYGFLVRTMENDKPSSLFCKMFNGFIQSTGINPETMLKHESGIAATQSELKKLATKLKEAEKEHGLCSEEAEGCREKFNTAWHYAVRLGLADDKGLFFLERNDTAIPRSTHLTGE